ncbi:hypothetical protein HYU12_05045, partial [Candidatus Woesearchaeota archaeon]|nr:hypothetical protein [Candidatus Woesearchaeota archaeon]
KFKKVKSEQTSKKLVRISTVHTEVQYHLPGKSSKLADLALINEDEILISKEGYSLNGKIKKSRLIEIKHHQSLKKCKDAITKSCKKLVGQKIKKQGYVICFHSRKPNQKNKEWLKKEDINRIENKGVKIIYVTQEGDCITKPKTLLKNA